MFPLFLWLPPAYSAASAPVAALFAIMTKVGIYSILRVYVTVFGPAAGDDRPGAATLDGPCRAGNDSLAARWVRWRAGGCRH